MERTMRTHLDNLLPLRNPSLSSNNPVMLYCYDALRLIDRTPVWDEVGNIYHIPDPEEYNGRRGIVGHTDSVMQKGKPKEAVTFDGRIYSSKTRNRPIGGDDKVGVAIALTIAEARKDVSVILCADEEVGCVGSSELELPYFDLLVQCDRRGITDVVTNIGGPMCSQDFEDWLEDYMPWRKITSGMMTDVEYLCRYAGNSVNLSCGYYNPHSVDEFIVLSQAQQTLTDALLLLDDVPEDIKAHEYHRDYEKYDDYAYWRWDDEKYEYVGDSEYDKHYEGKEEDDEAWRQMVEDYENGRVSVSAL